MTRQRGLLDSVAGSLGSPLVLAAGAGCVTAQVALLWGAGGGWRAALWIGVKVTLALWAAWTVWQVLWATAGGAEDGAGSVQPDALDGMREGPVLEAGRTATSGVSSLLARWPAWQIGLGGAVLVAIGSQRTPGRLVLSLVSYAVLATFVIWLVEGRGGRVAASRAAAVLVVFAVVATTSDWRVPPEVLATGTGSPFRWAVGWPDQRWVLRHELELSRTPGPTRVLLVPLAQSYAGPARVAVRLNGVDLGSMEHEQPGRLRLALPDSVVAARPRLSIELRQEPFDPALRMIAQRWTAGATRGSDASSYFDGQGWFPGTFDDGAGRAQRGVYVLQVESQP